MRLAIQRFSLNSIRVKLIGGLLLLTIPLILILMYTNTYAVEVVRHQVADSYRNMMMMYMKQLDSNLDDVDQYMNALVGSGTELLALNQAVTEEDYFRAKIVLNNRLRQDLVLYKSISAFFYYASEQHDFLPVQHKQVDYNELSLIQDYMVDFLKDSPDVNGFHENSWRPVQIGGEYYVIHIVQSGTVYVGAWVKAENLMAPLNQSVFGKSGGPIFATAEGKPMTNAALLRDPGMLVISDEQGYRLSGKDNEYLLVGERSSKSDFSLIAVIPDDEILQNLPYFQKLASLVPFASLIVIPIGLFFLRRTVMVPIYQLVVAMKRIRDGNWGVRIESSAASDEFRIVHHTFNTMVEQIQMLTVNVYEEKLEKQREELQRMQLQINPHFFLNSLNIIYHLAKVKDYVLIKEMSQCLIRYFRFMFRSHMSFVKLKDELEHTVNYLRIQELRFPGQLTYEIDAPNHVRGELVPPLVIQTFVENTIKHSVTLDEPIHLHISADIHERGGVACLNLVVKDTGKGFPEEVLRALFEGRTIANEEGEHIGIWNVQRRLKLLYEDEADIHFYNQRPSGAVVNMSLPLASAGE